MKPESVTFTMRVDRDLRDAFAAAADANHRPASMLLRDFMRAYVRDHSQSDLFTAARPKARKPAKAPRKR